MFPTAISLKKGIAVNVQTTPNALNPALVTPCFAVHEVD